MMVDITKQIRDYLLSQPDIVSLVVDRVGSPKVFSENGEEAPNPKIAFRQMGGGKGEQRYQFLITAGDAMGARELSVLVVNNLVEEAVGFPDCNIVFVRVDGGIIDTEDEKTRDAQCLFYIVFEMYEF